MKRIKLILSMLLAMLATQTTWAQDNTEMVSKFCLWQQTATSDNEMRGLLNTYNGYQWELKTDDPTLNIEETKWGEQSDSEPCYKFGEDPDKSITINLRPLFRIQGTVKRVTVRTTGYFKSLTVSLIENTKPLETPREVQKSNIYGFPFVWFDNYDFEFGGVEYDYAGITIRIDGPTPTYISSIIIEIGGGTEPEKGDANGDGEIDVADIDFVIEHIGEPIDDTNKASDVNGDGEINVADVDYIIERIK